jgi:hypothetical protein
LVQAFPKKWWVESNFTAPSLPLSKQVVVRDIMINQGLGLAYFKYFRKLLVVDGDGSR